MALMRRGYGYCKQVVWKLLIWAIFVSRSQSLKLQTIYVTSSAYEEPVCKENPCNSLNYYAQHSSQYFISDMTITFLPGFHELNTTIGINNVTHLVMTNHEYTKSLQQGAHIVCSDDSSVNSTLVFESCAYISLYGLQFSHCGGLAFNAVTDITLDSLSFEHSMGGVVIENSAGTVTISNSSFSTNRAGIHLIVSWDQFDKPCWMELMRCNFQQSIGSSLSVHIGNPVNYTDPQISVAMVSVEITLAQEQALTFDLFGDSSYSITMSDLVLSRNDALSIFVQQTCSPGNHTAMTRVFQISKSNIYDNSAGLHLHICDMAVSVKDTLISYNKETFLRSTLPPMRGMVLGIMPFNYHHSVTAPIVFRNVTVNHNGLSYSRTQYHVIAYIQNIQTATLIDCHFMNNARTPLQLVDSIVSFSGTVSFSNNKASIGGAISLLYNSTISLADNAHVLFVNNSVVGQGGAIYIDQGSDPMVTNNPFCFMNTEASTPVGAKLTFVQNFAQLGGDAIYGNLEPCAHTGALDFLEFVNPDINESLSLVSGTPSCVCLCNESIPDCSDEIQQLKGYPGQTFHIEAILLSNSSLLSFDQIQATGGTILAELYPLGYVESDFVSRLGHLQGAQPVDPHGCTQLNYTISTWNEAEFVALTAEYSPLALFMDPLLVTGINVTILDCPLGFQLHGNPPNCTCNDRLTQYHITCDINTQTVHRPAAWWISAEYSNGTFTHYVVVHKHCPYGNCKFEDMNLNLEYPDEQCSSGHSGTLCGKCRQGYSLTFGTGRCKKCSNSGLLLLVLFAFLGIALVAVLKIFNLTVTVGAVNGIIIFANIVNTESSVFFHEQIHFNFLQVFISWLNLNLGIETCFFDGMDPFSAIFLQFAFPVYIWCLVLLIIIISRYSTAISEQNWVPVLSTLFLLSYSKIVHNVIIIFSYTTVDYDGRREVLWGYDANIRYASARHIVLIIVALTFLICFLLPYTFLLVMNPLLHKISSYCISSWLLKLKPFFDANFAPFNDMHRYWLGVLLVLRILLLSIVDTNTSSNGLFFIAVVTTALLTYIACASRLYKNKYLGILENSFHLNLSILASGTLYVHITSGNLLYLVIISLGIAFIQFIVIFIVHGYVYALPLLRTVWEKSYRKRTTVSVSYQEINNKKNKTVESVQTVYPVPATFSELRESILEQ